MTYELTPIMITLFITSVSYLIGLLMSVRYTETPYKLIASQVIIVMILYAIFPLILIGFN